MAEMRTAVDVDDLLSNAEWLRVLASRLIQDDSEVEDLLHETWVAALRRPVEEVRNRPSWLAAVICNLSRRRLRQSGRHEELRQDHELALEDSAPSPPEACDLEIVRRRVVEAVLALPEPFRSTVLMSFYQGLPSREIARRAGVPDATVRTRLRRALLRLRSKLETESERRAGCTALALLAGPAAGPARVLALPTHFARVLPGVGLAAAAVVFALFTLAVSRNGGAGRSPADALALDERADRGVAPDAGTDHSSSAATDIAGPEAIEFETGAVGAGGPVHEDPAHFGSGLRFDEAFGEGAPGLEDGLPQPSLRSDPPATSKAPASSLSYLAVHPEDVGEGPAAASIAVPISSRWAGGIAAPSHIESVPAGASPAEGWKARGVRSIPLPSPSNEDDTEEDEEGRLEWTGPDPSWIGDATRAVPGDQAKTRRRALASISSLQSGSGDDEAALLCICPERPPIIGPRPRLMWISPVEHARELRCPLHSEAFEGRAWELVECGGAAAVLVAWDPLLLVARSGAPFEVVALIQASPAALGVPQPRELAEASLRESSETASAPVGGR